MRNLAGARQLAATLGAGMLAEVIGLRLTIALAPIGGLLGAAILWNSPVRRLVTLPSPPDVDAAVDEARAEDVRTEPFGG